MQSHSEFQSHQLNRDTWSHEAVQSVVKENFVLWQTYNHSENGMKMTTFYKLQSIPYTMIIDPLTGAKLAGWEGFNDPERLLEVLVPFMEKSPAATGNSMPELPRPKSQKPQSKWVCRYDVGSVYVIGDLDV